MRQRPQDIREAIRGGLLGTVGSAAGSDQADAREAALALLALLVQHPGVVAVAKQVLSTFLERCCHLQTGVRAIRQWPCFPLRECLEHRAAW